MKKTILTLLTIALIGAQAYAVTGTIGFSGKMSQFTTKKGVTTNVFIPGKMKQVTTKNGVTKTILVIKPWSVIAGQQSGDYSSVPNGFSPITMGKFSFTGNNTLSPTLLAPVVQWTFTLGGKTYNFTLTGLTSASSSAGSIAETGVGTACIGKDCSHATWALDGTGGRFRFTASVHTTAVPDGGPAVALLGIALAAIECGRRMIRARKA